MTSNRSIKSDICAVEGCEALRLEIKRGGRVWRSSLCHRHDLARQQEYQRGTFYSPNASTPYRQFTPAQVYTMWGKNQELGQVWYQGRKVYGLMRFSERWAAVVAGLNTPMHLPNSAILTIGKD